MIMYLQDNNLQKLNYRKTVLILFINLIVLFLFNCINAYCNEDDLVKGSGDAIYYIHNNERIGIPDPDTFTLLGFKWSDVITLTDAQLALISEGQALSSLTDGVAIRRNQALEVSLISGGQRKPVPDEETLIYYGGNPATVISLDAVFFDLISLGTAYESIVQLAEGDVVHQIGDLTVYYIHNGQRTGIPDQATLNILGFTLDDVQSVAEAVITKYPIADSLSSLTDGVAIRRNLALEVSLISGGQRKPVPDEETLIYYGGNPDTVISLDAVFFDLITVGEAYPTVKVPIAENDLIRMTGDLTVYYIQNGQRRGIPGETFDLLHFSQNNVKEITQTQMNTITLGTSLPSLVNDTAINRDGALEVSIIKDGARKPVPDEETLESLGISLGDVLPLDGVFFDLITVGVAYPSAKVPIAENDLIRMTGDLTVYYIQNGQRRGIPGETFVLLHFSQSNVKEITQTQMNTISLGTALPSLIDDTAIRRDDTGIEVSIIKDGVRKPVPDEETLESLGISLGVVLALDGVFFVLITVGVAYPSAKVPIAENDLIRMTGDLTVYYIQNGQRRGIPGETFVLLHFSQSNVKEITQTQMNTISLGASLLSLSDGTAIRRDDTGIEVSIIKDGVRKPVPDEESLESLGKSPGDVLPLDGVFFDLITVGVAYPSAKVPIAENDLIRMPGDLTVYYIQNGQRRGIPGETFDLLNFSQGNVKEITQTQMNTISLGTALPSLIDGTAIRLGDSGHEVSIIEAGKRRPVPDEATLANWCGSPCDVIPLEAVFFDRITLGEAYVPITETIPTIISVTPHTFIPSQITLTITGKKFDDGCIDEIYNENHHLVYSGINNGGLYSRSDTQLIIQENLSSLSPGNYSLYVKNSTGQKSNSHSLSIKSPFTEGVLIRGPGDPTVYYVHNGKRIGIPDPETFDLLHFDWTKVIDLPDITNIPKGVDLKPLGESCAIKSNGEMEISIIKSGKRRPVPDPETLAVYWGKSFDEVISLDPVFLDKIWLGTPYTSVLLSPPPKISSISHPKTLPHIITLTIKGEKFDNACTDEIYDENGQLVYSGIGAGSTVVRTEHQLVIQNEDLSGLGPGNYMLYIKNSNGQQSNGKGVVILHELAEGDLVRGSGPTIFFIHNGKKIGIPDETTLGILGFNMDEVIEIPDTELAEDNLPLSDITIPVLKNDDVIRNLADPTQVDVIQNKKRMGIPNENILRVSLHKGQDDVISLDSILYNRIAWGGVYQPHTSSNPSEPSSSALGEDRLSAKESDPVNIATGNYTYECADLVIPGRGFPFKFHRTYNSADSYSGPFGQGWTHSYNIFLTQTFIKKVEKSLVIKWGDGREDFYDYIDDNYISPYGPYDIIEKIDTIFTVTKQNQTKYSFEQANSISFNENDPNATELIYWRLSRLSDQNDNSITFTYDQETGNLILITDTVGRQITLSYDAKGDHVEMIADPIGRELRYSYRGLHLITFTDARNFIHTYNYNDFGYLSSMVDPNNITFVINQYNDNGKVIFQDNAHWHQTAFSYDESSKTTVVKDPLRNETTYVHDERNRLIKKDNSLGKYESFTYDDQDNITSKIDYEGNVFSYTYDSAGNLTSQTDPFNHTSHFEYDNLNNPIKVTDKLENVACYTYDTHGNLTNTLSPLGHNEVIQYDNSGNPLSIIDKNGNTTFYSYDAQGNLIQAKDPLGGISEYTYDEVGRMISQTDANGHTILFSYDENNNLVSVTDPLGNAVRYEYDCNNKKTAMIDPKGNKSEYAYDAYGMIVSLTDPLGNIQSYQYDELMRKIKEIDPRGNNITYTYDSVGNRIKITDALGNSKEYTFDANGNITSETNPLGNKTIFSYDSLNRPLAITDPLGNAISKNYDALGRIIKDIDAKGEITAYGYDPLDRPLTTTDAQNQAITYEYDAVGNRISLTDTNGRVTTFAYDKANRLITQTDPLGNSYHYEYDLKGNTTMVQAGNGDQRRYSYDDAARLIAILYPDSSQVTYHYDENGNLMQMDDALGTSSLVYDELDRMTQHTDSDNKAVQYEYDASGNTCLITYPDGKKVQYAYDALNRMISVIDWLGNETNYSYDSAGNLCTTTYPNGTVMTYVFDSAGRITGLANEAPDKSVIAGYSYTLDKVGNIINSVSNECLNPFLSEEDTQYTYDTDNRLTAFEGKSCLYDKNGNLIKKGDDSFIYDYENHLIQRTISGVTTRYFYDGKGRRRKKIVNGKVTKYILDINSPLFKVLAETNESGEIQSYYVYGIGLISKITADGQPYYYHYNSLGSTIALTDASGSITDKYAYDDFGRIVNQVGITENPFKYVGRYGVMDEGNGLYFMRARYYDATVGRFLSLDPIGLDGGDLNLYSYVGNNPINWFDPWGLIRYNKPPPVTVPVSGKTLEALQCLESCLCTKTGKNINLLVTGGAEKTGHSINSHHYIGEACDLAGPKYNPISNSDVMGCAGSCGFGAGMFEDWPNDRRDHWHLQLTPGNGVPPIPKK